MNECALPNYRFQKVIENKIKRVAEPDLGSDRARKKRKTKKKNLGWLKRKKGAEEQLERGREAERPREQFSVELMSNILQQHNLCHTPLLQEELSNRDEEDDFIFSLKSLTGKTTKQ